jgi:hypothetical protein
MSRMPGYETSDYTGYDRETMAHQRRPASIGRYDHHQAVTPRARQDQISDLDLRRRQLRLLELQQAS